MFSSVLMRIATIATDGVSTETASSPLATFALPLILIVVFVIIMVVFLIVRKGR